MQIVIEISEDDYKEVKEDTYSGTPFENRVFSAITNGTPIPDNATNGDVIKAMFDVIEEHFYDEDRMVDVYGLDRTDDPSTFYADWWNAPYQKGGKE